MAQNISEAYSEPCLISQTERFAIVVNGLYQLTIFAKHAILNIWHGFEYASGYDNTHHDVTDFNLTLLWWSLYHIKTSPLICRANQWTRFYMKGTSVIKELNWIFQ